ncbi:uncharacterized protein LOC122296285 [Carya illinoinensis]|uniref:uncharacterized protein LOC122296285 n=1 Tax=Carya illinoinensis TaxID=32201 RepID=UPI001C726B74|nr:uncharacterized protein LOC122296285 [Carya illinoinensis]
MEVSCRGFKVEDVFRGCITVSHLLFANDTLLFNDANQDHLRALRALLLCFEAVFGLGINLNKSEIVPVGSVSNIYDLANIMGCKVSSLPMKYLGLPLEALHRSVSIWDGVIQKIETRLAGWKKIYLSKGGSVTLIKSTLSNLPTYFLSLFPIPMGVVKIIERIFRNFLWDGTGEQRKFHLVNWKKVCTPVTCGGLGVRNLTLFNKALLRKWLWRITKCKGAIVADSYLFSNNMLNWNVEFTRDLQDWEVSEVADFYAILYDSKIDQNMDDML